jgi:dolichyl-diphosphooligosaccharide--protein glycosyltransferase
MRADRIRFLRRILFLRPEVSHSSLLRWSILALIFILAFTVRVLPIRWGYYLNEFDPYYHYRQTKYIVENGLFGERGWASWHDYLSWYPWGNEIRRRAFPGLPVLAAAMYMVLDALNVPFTIGPTLDPLQSDPVYIFCVIFPVIMGSITCIAMYFLGRELGGDAVGMFAALFLALDNSYIARTSLGFFDDESVGILSLLLFMIFFNRAMGEAGSSTGSLKEAVLSPRTAWSVAAGLTLGYLTATWGASRYVIALTAVFVFVLLVIGRYSPRLLSSYAITFFIALSIASCIPRLGSRFPLDYLGTRFIFEYEVLSVYGVFFLLLFAEVSRRAETKAKRLYYFLTLGALLVIVFIVLWVAGKVTPLGPKFMSVLNPSVRFMHPLVESVAEHRPSAWSTFYYNFGIGVLFFPVGLYFATMMATNLSIFAIIYGLTSVFSASSMIRLNILMSPPISLFFALAIVRILRPFVFSLREPGKLTRRRERMRRPFGKEASMLVLLIIFVLLMLVYVIGTDFAAPPAKRTGPRFYLQAYSPTSISSASLSVKPMGITRDWLNALTWIRLNTPPSPSRPGEAGTVVASWWDYGYWITAIANRSSLADNGTWNTTQIQQIGLMFMSTEEEAVKILRRFNVTHVLVFTTFDTQGRIAMAGGDEGKWQWMARIPGLDEKSFGNYTLGWDWIDMNKNGYPDQGEIIPNPKGLNTTLYKLMTYGREMTIQGVSNIELRYFEKAYFSQEPGSPRPAPGTRYVALVCIYKVNYPPE